MPDKPVPHFAPLRLALISLHTSPVARLGGKKTGGMNVYVNQVARELGRRGILVDVFTRAQSPEELDTSLTLQENVRLIYLPCGDPQPIDPNDLFPHLNQFRDALLRFAKQEKLEYDGIYSHYWLSGWVAIHLKQAWGVPFAQMFHTLGMMKTRIATDPRLRPVFDNSDIRVRGETAVMEHADRIIAATEAERSQLLMLYRADRRKIDIVPPGVDTDHFFPGDREAARQRLGWQDTCSTFLFVGRIEPLKGVDTIFEALNHIRQQNPADADRICAAIIGGDLQDSSDELQRLRLLREMLGLESAITFLGAQSQDVLPDYYRAAEALIMPSDYESFGMVALEAMACGTPVIASEVGGLAYLVQDDQTGFHVPVREPAALAARMLDLANHPQKRFQMGVAAAHLAAFYSWSQIVDQLLAVFTMLGTRPRILHFGADDEP